MTQSRQYDRMVDGDNTGTGTTMGSQQYTYVARTEEQSNFAANCFAWMDRVVREVDASILIVWNEALQEEK